MNVEALKAARVNRGLTIREAARQMGVPVNTLQRAEAGDTKPFPQNAYKIASFYGFMVTDIWPVETDPKAAA